MLRASCIFWSYFHLFSGWVSPWGQLFFNPQLGVFKESSLLQKLHTILLSLEGEDSMVGWLVKVNEGNSSEDLKCDH
eukprot:c5356_g2_i1 orf=218-448(+)